MSQPIDHVSWYDVVNALRQHRLLAAVVFAATVLCAIAVAYLMPPIYRSEVLLVPAREEQSQAGLSSVLGKLGGLAGVAGVGLPVGGSATTQQAIALLKSRGFIADFIETRHLMPALFPDQWDPVAKRWAVESDQVPTIDDGVERFRRRVLSVEDSGGSTVRVIVDWRDRESAAVWANDLVAMLNERARQRAIAESKRSLAYLNEQLSESTAVAVRESIYRLIAENMNRAMLATVRKEYVFEVLDPAVPADADRPLRPRKWLLLIIGVMAGAMFAALSVAVRVGFRRTELR